MKRIVRRVQSLNERAAELTAAVGQLPQRVAELRGAVSATTGELHHLKHEIQGNVADLRVDREEDLAAALAEIAGHAPLLAEVGFVLDGFDIEVSPVQQLVIDLIRHDDVAIPVLQSKLAGLPAHGTVAALLSAILKARAVADAIDIDGLDYHQLEVTLGPVPSIRLCWRGAVDKPAPAAESWRPDPIAASHSTGASFFGTGGSPALASMPHAGSTPARPAGLTGVDAPQPPVAETASVPAAPEPVRQEGVAVAPPPLPIVPPPLPVTDPLARFKVMPDLASRR